MTADPVAGAAVGTTADPVAGAAVGITDDPVAGTAVESDASLEPEEEYDALPSPESELASIGGKGGSGGRGVGDAEAAGTDVAMHSTGSVRHNRVREVVIVKD